MENIAIMVEILFALPFGHMETTHFPFSVIEHLIDWHVHHKQEMK